MGLYVLDSGERCHGGGEHEGIHEEGDDVSQCEVFQVVERVEYSCDGEF